MIHFKLISDRRHQYPAIRSLDELLICATFLAYDSRQACVVAIDPSSKNHLSQIIPFQVEKVGQVLNVYFSPTKNPNTEMRDEIFHVLNLLLIKGLCNFFSVKLESIVFKLPERTSFLTTSPRRFQRV